MEEPPSQRALHTLDQMWDKTPQEQDSDTQKSDQVGTAITQRATKDYARTRHPEVLDPQWRQQR